MTILYEDESELHTPVISIANSGCIEGVMVIQKSDGSAQIIWSERVKVEGKAE